MARAFLGRIAQPHEKFLEIGGFTFALDTVTMSTQTITKKRKTADGATASAKKVKITNSAEKSAPLKSALKKRIVERAEVVENVTKPLDGKKEAATAVNNTTGKRDSTKNTKKTLVENDEDGGTELTPDQTAALLAGFSSSEEDEVDDGDSGIAISSLPKAPTTGLIQKRINQAISKQSDPETTPGVIYIGRIPHGFYEHQMRAYLSQFGRIVNLRLARNKKTGNSQHYGFVEFASAAVADIVVKTMDKYLLFGHLLQVRRVPREQVREGMWKVGRRRRPAPRNRMERGRLRRGASREVWEGRVEREVQRRKAKGEKLREMGYEFEMPGVRSVGEVPVKVKEVVEVGGDAGNDRDVDAVQDNEAAARPEMEETETETTQIVQAEPETVEVTEENVTKKRPAVRKPQTTKKVVKKVKT